MIGLLLALTASVGWIGIGTPDPPGIDSGPATARASISVHRQPGVPIAALRLSVLTADPAGYSGAGHMLQHVLYPSLQERAARIGGTVQVQRTADAMVYSVTGPTAELQYMADLLISTLERPEPPVDAVLRAERELREERLAEWETAPAHVRSVLRAQLFPADLSAAGTDRSATRFSSSTLPAIWADMYDPSRVSIVAVGDVHLGDVERAFAAIPPALEVRRLGIERDSVALNALAPPQATQHWFGTAYMTTDLDPAAVSVTARLLGDLLRDRLPSAQVTQEHWWTHHGQALTVVISIPGPEAAAARRSLGTAVATLLDDVTFLDVIAAATAIRREMLFYSRTPDRMAELIGQFVDREGDPNATERFYAALDRLDDRDVREVLETILERTPARIEVPPQALQPRRR